MTPEEQQIFASFGQDALEAHRAQDKEETNKLRHRLEGSDWSVDGCQAEGDDPYLTVDGETETQRKIDETVRRILEAHASEKDAAASLTPDERLLDDIKHDPDFVVCGDAVEPDSYNLKTPTKYLTPNLLQEKTFYTPHIEAPKQPPSEMVMEQILEVRMTQVGPGHTRLTGLKATQITIDLHEAAPAPAVDPQTFYDCAPGGTTHDDLMKYVAGLDIANDNNPSLDGLDPDPSNVGDIARKLGVDELPREIKEQILDDGYIMLDEYMHNPVIDVDTDFSALTARYNAKAEARAQVEQQDPSPQAVQPIQNVRGFKR